VELLFSVGPYHKGVIHVPVPVGRLPGQQPTDKVYICDSRDPIDTSDPDDDDDDDDDNNDDRDGL